jgi:CSLREA domain-containing protein
LTGPERLGDDRGLRHRNGVRVGILGVAAAALLMCGLPSVAGAQGSIQVVNATGDPPIDGCDATECTLREAIEQTNATEIQLPQDGYLLDDQLVISRPLTIRGTQDDLAVITANSETEDRVITVAPEISVQLFRLSIVGGNEEDPPGGFPDEGLGGGLYVPVSSSLTVTDSEIVGNRAVSGGGVWSSGTLTLVRTTVAGNTAFGVGADVGLGGGVGLEGTTRPATFTNTTFSGNEAASLGGGIFTRRSMTLRNVSIIRNVAPPPSPNQNGAGLYQQFGPGSVITARNTLLALNANGGCGGTASIQLDSNNGLLDELDRVPGPSCNADPGDNTLVNAGAAGVLADLEDNGGLTRTHALTVGSPALDTGVTCPADDQRGFPRRVFECDIGAYEFGAENLTADVSVFTDELTQPGCTVDHCTLRERVETADNDDEIILAAGTYELTKGEPLELDQNLLEFEGAGVGLTTIDANGTSRVGTVDADAEARFNDVTVTGGDADVGNNDRPGEGGAFRIQDAGLLRLTRTNLVGNVASNNGGAVSNVGDFLFIESTASGNRSSGLGGGVYSLSPNGHTTIENSTVSGNTAGTRGGGVYVGDGSQLEHVTITGNSAGAGGAGLYAVNSLGAGLYGTLVAGNAGPECGVEGLLDGHHNLADDMTCGFDAQGDLQGVDARLAPLGNYGGPTMTHALYTGSPALDGGDSDRCPAEDQRGVDRPDGPCDIGAYEGSIAPPAPPQSGGGTTQPPPNELPEPEAGKSVNVLPEGTVKVKLPGRNRFRTLTEGEQLPVGTIVDTLKGRVTLVAAGGQTADFFDGIFRIGQGKGARPLTTLTLVEVLTCPKAGNAVAAAKKKKRRLWGDGSGKFRTKGKHSAATVVGTRWLVEDSCTSTLTRVTRGRVSVRDFVKKKTVIVRAGKKYVARAKKK